VKKKAGRVIAKQASASLAKPAATNSRRDSARASANVGAMMPSPCCNESKSSKDAKSGQQCQRRGSEVERSARGDAEFSPSFKRTMRYPMRAEIFSAPPREMERR